MPNVTRTPPQTKNRPLSCLARIRFAYLDLERSEQKDSNLRKERGKPPIGRDIESAHTMST